MYVQPVSSISPTRQASALESAPRRFSRWRVVQTGDNLWNICKEYLERDGKPVTDRAVMTAVDRTVQANRIEDPDLILPGRRLDLRVLQQRSKFSTEPRRSAAVHAYGSAHCSNSNGGGEAWAHLLGAPARLTSPYGLRRHPVTGKRQLHRGVDLAAPEGTPIYPSAPGKVVFSGRQSGYGNVVIVSHDDGTRTFYGHASTNLAEVGRYVSTRDAIALVGSTGTSTGPHLHFEVRKNGRTLDPLPLLARSPVRLARNDYSR